MLYLQNLKISAAIKGQPGTDIEKVLETAKELQEVLKDIPVLLTFRTSKEGGEKEISVMTMLL